MGKGQGEGGLKWPYLALVNAYKVLVATDCETQPPFLL